MFQSINSLWFIGGGLLLSGGLIIGLIRHNHQLELEEERRFYRTEYSGDLKATQETPSITDEDLLRDYLEKDKS
jgi:hypothetical protein